MEFEDWNIRALKKTIYKGEEFYTITPLPLYVKRRHIIFGMLVSQFTSATKILDFGCGDGWYLLHLSQRMSPNNLKQLSGLDISSEMVSQTKKLIPSANVYQSSKGVKPGDTYDLIYSIAVFAHVEDDILENSWKGISQSLEHTGKFIICEQVAPTSYGGSTFKRRTVKEYVQFANSAGLKLVSSKLIDFRIHRFFERHIAKLIYKVFYSSLDNTSARLAANSSWLFRLLSKGFISFDFFPVKSKMKGWGYCFLEFEKLN